MFPLIKDVPEKFKKLDGFIVIVRNQNQLNNFTDLIESPKTTMKEFPCIAYINHEKGISLSVLEDEQGLKNETLEKHSVVDFSSWKVLSKSA